MGNTELGVALVTVVGVMVNAMVGVLVGDKIVGITVGYIGYPML